MTDWTEPKGAMFDVGTATNEETDDRNRVRDVKQDDACSDHAVLLSILGLV